MDKEIVEPVKEEAIEITTSDDVEQKIQDPAAEETGLTHVLIIRNARMLTVLPDFEPTSTVTIKTPDPQLDEIEETELNPVWTGQIVMAEVAKFKGHALPAAGECESMSGDVGEKLTVIGRIGYTNVRKLMWSMYFFVVVRGRPYTMLPVFSLFFTPLPPVT